jgi:phage-related protein
VLKLIEELEFVPEKYLKKLVNTNDVWEIRISLGSDIFRLLGFWSGNQMILTSGFAKKAQKTPPQEIALAEQRKKNYLTREKDQ